MLSAQLASYISWNVQTLLNQVCTLLNRVHTLLNQVRILLNRVRAEFSFLIRPVCLPVTWDWLLPTQVQAHKFNRHQPWPLPPFLPAPAGFAPLPPLPAGLGSWVGPRDAPLSGGVAGGSAAEAGVGAASAAALSAALSAAAGMLSWSSNLRLTSGAAAKSSNNQTMICSIVHNTSATNFNSSIPASPS